MRIFLILAGLLVSLSGCGTKGGLTLPPRPDAPPPPASAKPPADNSSKPPAEAAK